MITINGTTIKPNPSEITRGKFDISNAERTSSGLMVMDIIATKRRVDVTWQMLTQQEYAAILNALEGRTFHSVSYPDPQVGTRTITAYVGDIQDGVWHRGYWRDVTIPFIEQ